MVTEVSKEGMRSEHTVVTWIATTYIQWIVVSKQMAASDKRLYPRFAMGEDRVAVLHQLWQCKETGATEWRVVELGVEASLAERDQALRQSEDPGLEPPIVPPDAEATS